MVLVQFISDYEYVASEERGKTNALHICFIKGMIADVPDECAEWAIAEGCAESLEPIEPAKDAEAE